MCSNPMIPGIPKCPKNYPLPYNRSLQPPLFILPNVYLYPNPPFETAAYNLSCLYFFRLLVDC